MKNRFIDSLQSEILKKRYSTCSNVYANSIIVERRSINTSSGTYSEIGGGRCNTAYEVPGLIGIVGDTGVLGWDGIKMTTVSGGY